MYTSVYLDRVPSHLNLPKTPHLIAVLTYQKGTHCQCLSRAGPTVGETKFGQSVSYQIHA